MKKSRTKIILVAIATLAMGVVAGIIYSPSFVSANDVPVLSEVSIETSYAKGEVLTVPAATVTVGGEQKAASAYLHHPDGSVRVLGKEVELDVMGNYSLEYRTVVSGVAYSFEKPFTVYTEKFQIVGDKGSAEYKTYDYVDPYSHASDSFTGEFIRLYEGEKLIINDYFDISKATKNEPFIHLAVIPETFGTYDYASLYFKFVNKKDPSQYLIVNANYSSENDMTYFSAGSEKQTPSGIERNAGKETLHVGNRFGAPWQGSFSYGDILVARKKTVKRDTMRLYLDYEEKTMYANEQKGFIIDLDSAEYFSTIWEGFEDGAVSVEISAGNYQGTRPAQFMILDVSQGDVDITEQTYTDAVAPEISIDFGAYTDKTLPDGIAGYPYSCFAATATDWYSGDCVVKTRVFGRYNSSQKYEINVRDGKFVPDSAGEYVVEYTARDFSGNEAKATYTVNVKASGVPIEANAVSPVTSGKTGESIPVAELSASGGMGELAVTPKVTKNEENVKIENGSFRPEKSGEYVVSYRIVDFAGQEKEVKYSVSVSNNDKAVFIDKIVLPKFFIDGSAYVLPEVTAYDYTSDGEVKKIKAVAEVVDAGAKREITNGVYTPAVANHLDKAIVRYKATVGENSAYSEEFAIPVCKVGKGNNVDMSKYFVGDGITTSATADYVEVTSAKSGKRVYFANPLLADSFEVTFDIDPLNNGCDKINFYLTDAENGASVKVTYTKQAGSTSLMSINDGKNFMVNSSFYGTGSSSFFFRFNGLTNKLGNNSSVDYKVTADSDGNPFDGFISGKVYFSYELENAVRDTAVRFKNLCSQKLSSSKTDISKPKVSFKGERELRYHLGDAFAMPWLTVVDVLDANPTAYYSVIDPEGNIVIDDNGVRLEEVSPSYRASFAFIKHGFYTIDVYAEDWNGRKERNGGYSMEVIDEIAPVIKVTGTVVTSANVGEAVEVAEAVVTDNISATENIRINVLVKTPLETYVPVMSNNKFVPSVEGEYTVIYYALDESGNTAKLSYTVKVGGGNNQ